MRLQPNDDNNQLREEGNGNDSFQTCREQVNRSANGKTEGNHPMRAADLTSQKISHRW